MGHSFWTCSLSAYISSPQYLVVEIAVSRYHIYVKGCADMYIIHTEHDRAWQNWHILPWWAIAVVTSSTMSPTIPIAVGQNATQPSTACHNISQYDAVKHLRIGIEHEMNAKAVAPTASPTLFKPSASFSQTKMTPGKRNSRPTGKELGA